MSAFEIFSIFTSIIITSCFLVTWNIINYCKNFVDKYNKDYNNLVDDYNSLLKEHKQNIEDYNFLLNDVNENHIFKYNMMVDKYNDLLLETKLLKEEPKEVHLNFLLEKVSLLGEESLTEKQKLYLKKFSLK
jgi:hypothetical protein